MFYSYNALSKKGPLASIWLAVHWEKKLSKATICSVSVKDAVDEVKKPTQELAFRTTGHLLLGIVRIYAKKTNYLFSDAHDIVLRLKAAFTSSGERLLLDEDDAVLRDPTPLRDMGIEVEFIDYDEDDPAVNGVRPLEITLPEEDLFDFDDRSERTGTRTENSVGLAEDSFDIGSDRLARAGPLFGNKESFPLQAEARRAGTPGSFLSVAHPSFDELLLAEDNFGDENAPLHSGVFDGAEPMAVDGAKPPEQAGDQLWSGDRTPFGDVTNATPQALLSDTGVFGAADDQALQQPPDMAEPMDVDQPAEAIPNISHFAAPNDGPDSFVLEPLNMSEVPVRHRATRKQRRLLVDRESKLSDAEIGEQVSDIQELLRPALDIAPPTKRIMKIKETGNMDYLMSNAGNRWLFGNDIRTIYSSHMEFGLRPADSDETLLSGHLREALDMAQAVEETIRPATPAHSEIEVNPMTPVAPDFIEQPSELFAPVEHTRRRTATPAPSAELLGSPVLMETDERPKTPLGEISGAGYLDATPAQPSGLRDESGDILDPLSTSRLAHERRKKDMTFISVAEKKELIDHITEGLATSNEITFSSFVSKDDSRKVAARRFFAILECRKNREIKIRQDEPYGEIYIERDLNLPTSASH
ncbi:hypothetical protein QR680_013764 [Steinernema hermaphroditum]|uniref:Rad21/Rec8-like protein N-terminal domain-containing protein n=1 Tax=Steinernema hermaphroditum TaxID=289476 RepID=A0AA39I968_9BILA|nr:hypothetical protein QR680_013764 [Steinernema hermaphroditum]